MTNKKEKFLIIRFSSFGDIVQGLRIPVTIKNKYPKAHLDWLTKEEYSSLVESNPHVDDCLIFPKKGGIIALFSFIKKIHQRKYSHIYDAHNNLRSLIVYNGLRFLNIFKRTTSFIQRPKDRLKRILLFRFHINLYKNWPFIGQISFLEPLKKWGINNYVVDTKEFYITESAQAYAKETINKETRNIAVMPSAAWPLKRWPLSYWQELLSKEEAKKYQWHFLGGKEDVFIDDLIKNFSFAKNYRGKTSLQESSAIINQSDLLISNDTGLLHVADQLNKKGLAFIGPSAFGYTMSKNISILETNLYCKPCSKDGSGKCTNTVYQKCLKSIEPELVMKKICEILG